MSRTKHTHFKCGYDGCNYWGSFRYDNRREYMELFKTYGNDKYRCTRHHRPEEVLSVDNLKREWVSDPSDQRPHGIYWGSFGLLAGPGFKAYAADFPPGTILKVTAEVVLP